MYQSPKYRFVPALSGQLGAVSLQNADLPDMYYRYVVKCKVDNVEMKDCLMPEKYT